MREKRLPKPGCVDRQTRQPIAVWRGPENEKGSVIPAGPIELAYGYRTLNLPSAASFRPSTAKTGDAGGPTAQGAIVEAPVRGSLIQSGRKDQGAPPGPRPSFRCKRANVRPAGMR